MTDEARRGTGADPPDEALDVALRGVVRRTGATVGLVYLLEEDGQALRLAVMTGLAAEILPPWPWRRLPLTAPMPAPDAIRRNRLVWVGGQEELARRYPRAAAALPYRLSIAAVPLTGARRCRGALVLLFPASHPDQATRRERDHIATSAHMIACLLDEAGRDVVQPPEQPRVVPIEDARADGRREAPACADFAERLPGGSMALDVRGRITFVTASAARLLGSSADRLTGTTPWESLPWLDDPVYVEQYRAAAITREPVAFTALRPPAHWLTFQLYPDSSGLSVRLAPVPAGAGLAPPVPSTVGEAPVASAAAAPAGRIYQLMHLATALTETVGIEDVVDLMAGQVLPAFEAQGLVLAEAEAGRLKITGYRGYSPEIMARIDGLSTETATTPAGQALTSGIPSFYASRQEMAPLYPDTLTLSDKQAWAFLPLVISGRPVGCCIISYDRPHEFTQNERAVLTSLAGLLAQTVDRARLYDVKNQLARDLQRVLLPRDLPAPAGTQVAARYLPAGRGLEVGGDFYDVIRLSPTTCAAVIGDVQGHDTAAAALTGEIRAAVHAAAGGPPRRVMGCVNRVVNDLKLDLLASCLYVYIDLEERSATLSSAGHPPPLLRDHDGRTRLLPVDPGPLLGSKEGAVYPPLTLHLPDDAVLALYTDGLVEVPGVDADLTTAAVADSFAHSNVADLDHVIDGLIHRSWPARAHADDITVLLLRTMAGIGGR